MYHFIPITLLFLLFVLRLVKSMIDSPALTTDFRETDDRSELTEVDLLRGGT